MDFLPSHNLTEMMRRSHLQVIICSFPTNSMGTSTAIKGNPSGRLPGPAGRAAGPMR